MLMSKASIGAALATAVALAGMLTVADRVAGVAHAFGGSSLETARELSHAFSEVAERIRPSVVNVSTTRKVRSPLRHLPDGLQSPFRDFFGDEFFDHFFGPRGRDDGEFFQRGVGTGVIVSSDGYIVTNHHVVAEADEVKVKLADERSFTAEVIGTDPKTDIAVLKIDADGLKAARLGDSDKLRVGELVIASGNPFGLNATVTAGIVSATGRANVGIADYEDFIQTDAAINPGNSGGPLVNLEAEVVGINTAIFSRSGGYMGIGFAIPSNMVKSIMASLIEEGRVVRGWLGIVIQNLDEGLAQSFGYDSTDGVLVGDVRKDGPADKAGLKPGDIIVRYNGKDVKSTDKLRSMVAETRPGTRVPVEVFRDGRTKKLTVEIGELEDAEAEASGREVLPKLDLGMSVRTLTPELARRLDLEPDTRGVVVTAVKPFGPAAEAGIRVNDVIVRVQDEAIENVDDFRAALRRYRREGGVRLVLRTGDVQRFAYLKLE